MADTPNLPRHPSAQEEYDHLQQTCNAIAREIAEVETLTGAKAGVHMDIQMKEDPDQQEQVTIQLFTLQLDRLRQLTMARGQAYFARLDFTPAGKKPETWYLGRWGVLNPMTLDPIVVDWRAPIANLYYSGQIGPMDYTAPDGRVEGELTLKRMLNVHERNLISLFDSGIVSQEAYLQDILGSVSTDRLKEIVTTIQAEQNIVIRHPISQDLLVQGAAGSGKTTIALHRIAYLLYAFRESLRPENMMILAPNPLFLSYISQVLPDLGVERVVQTTFENWCREAIGSRMPKLCKESRLEKNLSLSSEDRKSRGRFVHIKGSLDFLHKLEAYLNRLQYTILPENGFRMAGVILMDRKELESVFLTDLRHFPLERRIDELKKIIIRRLQSSVSTLRNHYAEMTDQLVRRIVSSEPNTPLRKQKIDDLYTSRDQRYAEIDTRAEAYLTSYRRKFPSLDLFTLYCSFIDETFSDSNEWEGFTPSGNTFRPEDLPALLMICKYVYGIKTHPMKHIVIDECQDFSPFQIELLRRINPAATFTLVGDLYQGIRADEGIHSWEEWQVPVFSGKAAFSQLTVSYRNTVEIMSLAQTVAKRYPIPNLTDTCPVLRHGEPPQIIHSENEKDCLEKIISQVHEWKHQGFHSIALIEKTIPDAEKLFRLLPSDFHARLLSETDTEYHGGVVVVPASIAKGMEFDCVGLCDASADIFPDDEFLSRILYVILTRPLHRLSVWYRNALTPLLSTSETV